MISFESDYIAGAHPEVLRKLTETNLECVSGYGTDPYCESAKEKIRAAAGLPDAEIVFLAGGTQANLTVISAFLHDPKILVLDEPFVGLDPKAAFILKEKMRQLCERGSAVLFSSHVLEVVEKLCDRVGILVAGSFRQIGATEDIIADQSLEQVFLELDK